MNGFSNGSFNSTLSGVVSLTDGAGTEISDGNISTNNIDGNNISLDGSISSVGSNTINEFSNGISITNGTATIDVTNCQGIKATSLITISPIELSYLDNSTSNLQTQINALATSTDLTALTAQVNTLQTKTTGITYDASNNATNINNSLLRVYGNISFSGSLNSVPQNVFNYINSLSSNAQDQLNSLNTKTTNMSYSGGNTFFNSNVYVNALNEISNTRLSMLTDLGTTSTVETRFYNINSFINSISPFFTNIYLSQNFQYNMNWSTERFHAGENIDVSGNIVFGSSINGITSNVFNYLSGVTSSIQSQLNSITSNLSNFYVDKASIQSITGTKDFVNLNFTGAINSISSLNFSYLSGVTSSIQSQLNSITTNLSTNYVDKTSTQTGITGSKTFANLNANLITTQNLNIANPSLNFQKRTLFLSNSNDINYSSSYPTPVYYNTNTSMAENLPNFCYVNLTSGCTSFTVASLDNTEDYGKSFILSNLTLASITINSPYPAKFTGPFVADGTNTFNLPPFGRAIIVNNSTYWDVISLSSYYDWGRGGVYILGSIGNPYDNTIQVSYSCPDLTNMLNQPNISSSLGSSDRQDFSSSISGSYINLNAYGNSSPDCCVVYPGWGCVVYNTVNYTGTVLLNYKNSTLNPVCVKMVTVNAAKSIKIYYFDQMIGNL